MGIINDFYETKFPGITQDARHGFRKSLDPETDTKSLNMEERIRDIEAALEQDYLELMDSVPIEYRH